MRTDRNRGILLFLVLGLTVCGGCRRESGHASQLDALLLKNGVEDCVVEGSRREDCLLYGDDSLAVWLRRSMKWQEEDPIILWGDESLGAIFLFQEGSYLGTVRVMVWETPWWPSVQPWGDGIAILSYRWPDRDDRSPDDAFPVLLGQVHYVLDGEMDLVYETKLRLDFEDGGAAGVVPYLRLVTDGIVDGRELLLKVACRVPSKAKEPASVTILEAIDWDAKAGKFERPE
jgi:hypothetical protein